MILKTAVPVIARRIAGHQLFSSTLAADVRQHLKETMNANDIVTITTATRNTATDNTAVIVARTLPEAFRKATLYSDDRIYKLLRFPVSSMAFALDL